MGFFFLKLKKPPTKAAIKKTEAGIRIFKGMVPAFPEALLAVFFISPAGIIFWVSFFLFTAWA